MICGVPRILCFLNEHVKRLATTDKARQCMIAEEKESITNEEETSFGERYGVCCAEFEQVYERKIEVE